MNTFLLALDCGTTAIKAGVVDLRGHTRGLVSRPCPLKATSDGGFEHDPRAVEATVYGCLRDALAGSRTPARRIAAISVSTQRATVFGVDRCGEVIGRGISWQDLRGAPQIAALRRRIADDRYYHLTGLPNHPVFTLGKLLWLKRSAPAQFRRTSRFVLLHDLVLHWLGAEEFCCDWSNASLTGLLDVAQLRWSEEILSLAGLRSSRLPRLVPSGQPVGGLSATAARRTGLLAGTPLVAGGGDQQCAGLGAGAVRPGVVEITLGTAAVPLGFSERVARDPKRRITCCAHAVPGRWEVEGLQNSAGASLDWIRRLTVGERRFSACLLRAVARRQPGAKGLLYFPYLTGAAAPHWNAQATGTFLGLTLAHGRVDLVRAVMEGVSLETREILEVFGSLKVPMNEVRLTGGGTRIGIWNQIQADVFGRPVGTLENPEASLLGAAILAACGVRAYGSVLEAVRQMVRVRRVYRPRPDQAALYDRVFRRYSALARSGHRRGVFSRRQDLK